MAKICLFLKCFCLYLRFLRIFRKSVLPTITIEKVAKIRVHFSFPGRYAIKKSLHFQNVQNRPKSIGSTLSIRIFGAPFLSYYSGEMTKTVHFYRIVILGAESLKKSSKINFVINSKISKVWDDSSGKFPKKVCFF